jgi:hypothetical protein
MQCEPTEQDGVDWAGLHSPLLQKVVQLALGGNSCLPYGRYLMHRESKAAAAAIHAAVVRLSLVCLRWRAAVQAVLQQASWCVRVEREAAAEMDEFVKVRDTRCSLGRVMWAGLP